MINRITKTIFVSAMLSFSALIVKAQYTHLPVIPDQAFNVKTLGATGDGKTLDTQWLQAALDAAGKAGGKVIVPAGTYLTGPLLVKGKTEIVLEKDAVLRLINDIDHYPIVNNSYQNFLECAGASDVKISGKGTIDGQGRVWWEAYDAKKLTYRRPQMLTAQKGSRIEVTGVTFLNPPNTHMSLKDVNDVYIHQITIMAPEKSHNTDGINISATNCTIEDCDISTGDDNIAFNFGNHGKTGDTPECEHLLVTNCRFGWGHGLSIGSYTSGGLKDLKVQNCTFNGTTSGIRIKSARGRGNVVENLVYQDITMKNVKYPIAITGYYPKEPASPEVDDRPSTPASQTPLYRNILIKNVTIIGSEFGLRLWGLPEAHFDSISFQKVNISSQKGSFIYNADNVVFDDCSIISREGKSMDTFQAQIKGLK